MIFLLSMSTASATPVDKRVCAYCAPTSSQKSREIVQDLCEYLASQKLCGDGAATECAMCESSAQQQVPDCIANFAPGAFKLEFRAVVNVIQSGRCASLCPATVVVATDRDVRTLLLNIRALKADWLASSINLPTAQAYVKSNPRNFPPTAVRYIFSDAGLGSKWLEAIRETLDLSALRVDKNVEFLSAILSPFDDPTAIISEVQASAEALDLCAKTQQAFAKFDTTMTYCSAGWTGASGTCMPIQPGYFSYPSTKDSDYISVKCPIGTTSTIGAKSLFNCVPLPSGSVFAVPSGPLDASKFGFIVTDKPHENWAVTGSCEYLAAQCDHNSVCKDAHCFRCPGAGGSIGGMNIAGEVLQVTTGIIRSNTDHSDCHCKAV